MLKEKTDEIQGLIKPILDSMQLELIDLEIHGQGRRCLLRVYVDKAGGVSVEDCAQANRFIGHALDVADPFEGSYTLEVSSPGLDRPLKKPDDFKRYRGKLARINLKAPLEGNWTVIGRLGEVGDEAFDVQPEDGPVRSIPFSEIMKARLEVEF